MASTSLVKMLASTLGGPINTPNSGQVQPAADGTVTVQASDVPFMLAAGCSLLVTVGRWQNVTPSPLAATAGRIAASTSLTNKTLTIAHQPDVGRQLNLVLAPGGTLTAGNVAMSYIANDGTNPQIDNFALAGYSTNISLATSKGVLHVNSAIITNIAGGSTPGVQIDDTNSLALMVDQGFADFAVLKENANGADETIGTVASSAACVIPSTAPNTSTNVFGFAYSYVAPAGIP